MPRFEHFVKHDVENVMQSEAEIRAATKKTRHRVLDLASCDAALSGEASPF